MEYVVGLCMDSTRGITIYWLVLGWIPPSWVILRDRYAYSLYITSVQNEYIQLSLSTNNLLCVNSNMVHSLRIISRVLSLSPAKVNVSKLTKTRAIDRHLRIARCNEPDYMRQSNQTNRIPQHKRIPLGKPRRLHRLEHQQRRPHRRRLSHRVNNYQRD